MKKKIFIGSAVLAILLLSFGCYKIIERREVNDIFRDVIGRYQEAYRIAYLDLEYGEEIKAEDGMVYSIVQDENYTSIEDIKSLLESVFTQDYIEESKTWIVGTDNSLYKEIGGVLCRAHADAIGLGIPTELHKIESKSDTRLVLLALTDMRWFRFTLVKEGDEWFIDDMDVDWIAPDISGTKMYSLMPKMRCL